MNMREASRTHKTKAFTLIELLVVIAIIAILAAILFPVFGRARENGRRSSCSSNLKQIGLGIMQYTQDFDEAMPLVSFGSATLGQSTAGVTWKWMDAIYPYVKSEQVFNCPSQTLPFTDPGIDTFSRYSYSNPSGSGAANSNYGSYGANANYSENVVNYGLGNATRSPFGVATVPPTRISAIDATSTTIAVTDTASNGFGYPYIIRYAFYNAGRPIAGTAGSRYCDAIAERHLQTTNVLFCDGHVKSLKLDAMGKANGNTDSQTGLPIYPMWTNQPSY